MHILIKDREGKQYIVKKSNIRRVVQVKDNTQISKILFVRLKDTPITIPQSVEDFYCHLCHSK